VLYSHRSTVLHAYAGCMPDVLGLSGNDCVLSVVPMFHANAWGLPYNAPIAGSRLVFPGAKMADPATLADLIDSEGVTMAAGVPTVWTGLLAYLEQTGRKLPTLKRTVVGGSAVPLKMIREFDEKHGIAVLQGWGMTEMSPLGTVCSIKSTLAALPQGRTLSAAREAGSCRVRRADEGRGRRRSRAAARRQGGRRAQGQGTVDLQGLLRDPRNGRARCRGLVRNR
jgi:fatty-acyl-CoA synthase